MDTHGTHFPIYSFANYNTVARQASESDYSQSSNGIHQFSNMNTIQRSLGVSFYNQSNNTSGILPPSALKPSSSAGNLELMQSLSTASATSIGSLTGLNTAANASITAATKAVTNVNTNANKNPIEVGDNHLKLLFDTATTVHDHILQDLLVQMLEFHQQQQSILHPPTSHHLNEYTASSPLKEALLHGNMSAAVTDTIATRHPFPPLPPGEEDSEKVFEKIDETENASRTLSTSSSATNTLVIDESMIQAVGDDLAIFDSLTRQNTSINAHSMSHKSLLEDSRELHNTSLANLLLAVSTTTSASMAMEDPQQASQPPSTSSTKSKSHDQQHQIYLEPEFLLSSEEDLYFSTSSLYRFLDVTSSFCEVLQLQGREEEAIDLFIKTIYFTGLYVTEYIGKQDHLGFDDDDEDMEEYGVLEMTFQSEKLQRMSRLIEKLNKERQVIVSPKSWEEQMKKIQIDVFATSTSGNSSGSTGSSEGSGVLKKEDGEEGVVLVRALSRANSSAQRGGGGNMSTASDPLLNTFQRSVSKGTDSLGNHDSFYVGNTSGLLSSMSGPGGGNNPNPSPAGGFIPFTHPPNMMKIHLARLEALHQYPLLLLERGSLMIICDILSRYEQVHTIYALTSMLHRFCAILKCLNRLEEAIIVAQTAVHLYETVAVHFDDHNTGLASCTSLLAALFVETDMIEQAVELDKRAVDLSSKIPLFSV